MSLQLARTLVGIFEAYCAIGVAFAVTFIPAGLVRIDPGVSGAPWALRLLLLPGISAFWPLFAWRWAMGRPQPGERNAHRSRARVASRAARRLEEANR